VHRSGKEEGGAPREDKKKGGGAGVNKGKPFITKGASRQDSKNSGISFGRSKRVSLQKKRRELREGHVEGEP